MAKITQSWVGYLDRSAEQIKASILQRLKVKAPELSDHNSSNPLIIILDFFSGIAEMLGYYIDNMAREGFMGTARQFSSVSRLSKLIDYTTKAAQYASVDLVISLQDSAGALVVATKDVFIPKGTIITNGSVKFQTLLDATLVTGATSVQVAAANFEYKYNVNIGTTTGAANQKVKLPDNYVDKSILVRIDGVFWKLSRSFAQLTPTSKNVVVDVEEDGSVYAIFGDGVNGAIPLSNKTIFATYATTDGVQGNLAPNTINTFETPFSTGIVSTVLAVTNPDYSSNGKAIENAEDIRRNAPRELRTMHRAVTYQDYKDVAMAVAGVSDAEVKYCCGKFVSIYIMPSTKGSASSSLIQLVQDELNCKAMITTRPKVLAAGLSKVWVKAKIYGKPLFTENEIRIDVVNAAEAIYGYGNVTINNTIVLSDLIKQWEDLDKVDKVEIEKIQVEPYVRVITGTRPLNIVFGARPVHTASHSYRVLWNSGTSKFYIYRGGVLVGQVTSTSVFTDAYISITLTNSYSYQNNDSWEFKTTPSFPETFPASSIAITDYSAGYIDIGPYVNNTTPKTIYSDLTIITQNVTSNCLPPCNG